MQSAAGTEEPNTKVAEGVEMLPTWDSSQRDQLARTLADPVELKEDYTNKADTFGTGFASFFFGLALFVGSIIARMLFTPLQARPIAQGLNSLRVVLASYSPTLFVGFLQATFLFMLLMVATFMSMIQMFNAVFGAAVGRVITLAFLMVMLTSAGGISGRDHYKTISAHSLGRPDNLYRERPAAADRGRNRLSTRSVRRSAVGTHSGPSRYIDLGGAARPAIHNGPAVPAGRRVTRNQTLP